MIGGWTPCPACGRVEAVEVASRAELLEEMELLWAFHERRLRPGVPTRHLLDRVVFSRPPALGLARCTGCGTVRRSGERPDAVAATYAEESPAPDVLAALFRAQRPGCRAQARRLTRFAGPTGQGLEVGSYTGAFLAAAREAGWRFEGVDPNPAASAFARAHGLPVTDGTLEAVRPGRRFDAVAFWNCFDQLPDPRAAAQAARDLLGPGGVLAVRGPNGDCYLRLRRRLRGPLARLARAALALNNLLTFPYGFGFTPGSLRRLLEEVGFAVRAVRGDVLLPASADWLRRRAVLGEQAARALLRPLVRLAPARAPWFEVYAHRR